MGRPESTTEIDVGRRFIRFSELDDDALNVEYHVHTTRTDGQATVDEILRVASERGIRRLAFTEHVRRDTDWFPEFVDEVREAAVHFPEIEVFVGCEAKALGPDGELDVSDEILAEADIVLGSVHRIPDHRGGFQSFRSMDPTDLAETEHQFALGLLKNAPIDVLAHPGGMYQRFHGPLPTEYFRSLLVTSFESDVAIEISSSYLVEPEVFLHLCREFDPRVSIGSDVHRLEAIGSCRDLVRRYLELEMTE